MRGHEVVSTPLDGVLGILRLVRSGIALRHKIKPGLQQTGPSCKVLAPAECKITDSAGSPPLLWWGNFRSTTAQLSMVLQQPFLRHAPGIRTSGKVSRPQDSSAVEVAIGYENLTKLFPGS